MKARLPEGYNQSRGDMLRQYQKMQEAMQQLQKEHEETEYTASAAGGLATATINGKNEVVLIDVKPELVDPEDTEMMCDAIAAAVNEALRKSSDDFSQKMGSITGGLNLGGLM